MTINLLPINDTITIPEVGQTIYVDEGDSWDGGEFEGVVTGVDGTKITMDDGYTFDATEVVDIAIVK